MQFSMESANQPYLETALNRIMAQQTHSIGVHTNSGISSQNWQPEQSTFEFKEEEIDYEYSTDFNPEMAWHLKSNDNAAQTIISYVLNNTDVHSCQDPYVQSYHVDGPMNTTSTPRNALRPKSDSDKLAYPYIPEQYRHVFDEWEPLNGNSFHAYQSEPQELVSVTGTEQLHDDPNLPKLMNQFEIKNETIGNESTELASQPTKSTSRPRPNAYLRKQHQREQDKNRTRTLNVAFCRLRSCLPEIPKDTKLTKIRTLRYAITYIRHLMDQIHEPQSLSNSRTLSDELCPSSQIRSQHVFKMDLTDESCLRDSGFDSYSEK